MNSQKSFKYLRIAFGIVWAIDSVMAWFPGFLNNFESYLTNNISGQPPIVAAWMNLWIHITSPDPKAFAVAVAVVSTALAVCLIFGIFRKTTAWVGIIFSALIWTTTGCGGPYMSGSTDIGSSIIYIFVFGALLIGLSPSSKTDEKISTIPENKKDVYIKVLSLAVIILLAALVTPYFIARNETAPDASSMSPDMMQKTFDVPMGVSVPTISWTLTKDTLDGYDLYASTTNFTFTPQLINQAPIVDQGHIHLYIDGVLYVVFSNWYHIDSADLPPGKHTITVSLNANDHSVFWANGNDIEETQTINTY